MISYEDDKSVDSVSSCRVNNIYIKAPLDGDGSTRMNKSFPQLLFVFSSS